jgi:phage/plasmid primase-like uncharacterized protein
MARNSECKHDIGVYRVVGGEGLDVVEKCSECGTLITHESPKTKFNREKEEKKARKEAKKRAEEKEEENKSTAKKVEEKVEDSFDDFKKSVKKFSKEDKPKKSNKNWY